MNHEKLPQSMQETIGQKASTNGIAVASSHGRVEGAYNTTVLREPSCDPASATFGPSISSVGASIPSLPTPKNHPRTAERPHDGPFLNPLHQLSLSGHAQTGIEPRTSPRPTRESVLRRLSEALLRRSLTVIDMSQRDLQPSDSKLIKIAVMQNINLHTLKLGYNHLGDEGLITLAPALANSNLQSLDLGFTGVGDGGMEALANSFLQGDVRSTSGLLTKKRHKQIRQSKLNTLYLSGNCITTRGCLALSKMIQFGSCKLKKLHLTGNRIGVDGVRSLTRAVSLPSGFAVAAGAESAHHGVGENTMQELFLGGTGIGSEGCHAVAEMLSNVRTLRILSLADNDLGDRECNILSDAIKKNREHLPLEALQLSFNRISCIGVESLMNAVWGSTSLQEIRLDNNCIGDRGAQLIAVVVANVPSLKRLDVGFSSFTAVGMRALMKSIAESNQIVSLSISGNKLDTDGAKAVAYALAYNRSLKYFFMDNCAANHASQRHITAGIVSNSQVSLHTLTGFRIGAVAVTLGLPSALEQLTNDQVLKFILLMWEQNRYESQAKEESLPGSKNDSSETNGRHCTLSDSVPIGTLCKPLDPATVVAVAGRAYAYLGGDENLAEAAAKLVQYTPRDRVHSREPSLDCPVVEDAIMIEADSCVGQVNQHEQNELIDLSSASLENGTKMRVEHWNSNKNGAHGSNGLDYRLQKPVLEHNNEVQDVAPYIQREKHQTGDQEGTGRKRQNVDWLCHHIKHLHQLAQLPFNSTELWRLHQHFSALSVQLKNPNSTKVDVDDSSIANSISGFSSPSTAMETMQSQMSMMQNSVTSAPCASSSPLSFSFASSPPFSEISLPGGSTAPTIDRSQHSTISGTLGRKVSYRSLNEALLGGAFPTAPVFKDRGRTISTVMEEGIGNPAAQPRIKRQKQNRSKISYFPRIKAKVESFLEKDHYKALILLRQLRYTEQNVLSTCARTQGSSGTSYLSRDCTKDIETILMDMM